MQEISRSTQAAAEADEAAAQARVRAAQLEAAAARAAEAAAEAAATNAIVSAPTIQPPPVCAHPGVVAAARAITTPSMQDPFGCQQPP